MDTMRPMSLFKLLLQHILKFVVIVKEKQEVLQALQHAFCTIHQGLRDLIDSRIDFAL